MKKTAWVVLLIFGTCLTIPSASYAGQGLGEATSSLFLPTTGQAMNGQMGSAKTKIMAGLEAGLITTTAILGGVVGGPALRGLRRNQPVANGRGGDPSPAASCLRQRQGVRRAGGRRDGEDRRGGAGDSVRRWAAAFHR